MKFPYSTILTDMLGNAIMTAAEVAATDKTPLVPAKFLTLKDVLIAAFQANLPSDDKLSMPERYALGKLGFEIGKEAAVSIEDAAKIKERAGSALTLGIVYQVLDLIDAAAK